MNILRPRWIAAVTYVLSFLASLVFMFVPSASFTSATDTAIVVFHMFLSAGSAVCIWGAVKKRHAYEATGIPLVASALFAYAILLFIAAARGISPQPGASIGVGMLMLATVFMLIGRMYECIRLLDISEDVNDGKRR